MLLVPLIPSLQAASSVEGKRSGWGGWRPLGWWPAWPERRGDQLYPRGVAPAPVLFARGTAKLPATRKGSWSQASKGDQRGPGHARLARGKRGNKGGGRRTHPRRDVVHRLRAAAPAAQTPHPKHRATPAWPVILEVRALGPGSSLSGERACCGSGRAAGCLL